MGPPICNKLYTVFFSRLQYRMSRFIIYIWQCIVEYSCTIQCEYLSLASLRVYISQFSTLIYFQICLNWFFTRKTRAHESHSRKCCFFFSLPKDDQLLEIKIEDFKQTGFYCIANRESRGHLQIYQIKSKYRAFFDN